MLNPFCRRQHPAIRRLPANADGRDLVVGDLHGHRATLDAALTELSFEPARDRVFAVGDLVDRGPNSPGCLALLTEPWFHTVRGNHEDMLAGSIRELRGGRDARFTLHQNNGGDWLLANWPPDRALKIVLERIHKLPHVLVVGTGRDRYHVVHAGFDAGVNDAAIDANRIGTATDLMWSRERAPCAATSDRDRRDNNAELSTTYCGHVVSADENGHPVRAGSHLNLDTGLGNGLTLSIAVRDSRGNEFIHQQPAL